MVDVSLLPKKEEETEQSVKEQMVKVKNKGIFPTKSLVIGILIVLIAGGITVGVLIYQKAKASTLRGLENQITNLKTEESKYTEMEAQAKALQNQLNTLSNLINKHKYWSQVIKALADYTPNNVMYKSITFDPKDNKFTITGYTDNYESVARLMVSLKKMDSKEYFDSIELVSANLNKSNSMPTDEKPIVFSINFNLKESALQKTTPTTQKK